MPVLKGHGFRTAVKPKVGQGFRNIVGRESLAYPDKEIVVHAKMQGRVKHPLQIAWPCDSRRPLAEVQTPRA